MKSEIVTFVKSQLVEIHQGGRRTLFRKLRSFLGRIHLIPLVLLVRSLRPLVVIRFGCLINNRIGHLAGNTEFYLCKHELSNDGRKTIDFFCYAPDTANKQLMKMWSQTLKISPLIYPLWNLNRLLPGGKRHDIDLSFGNQFEYFRDLLAQTKAHVAFTSEEENFGYSALGEMGISKDTPFICFHARDSVYLNSQFPGRDWKYHDYRDANIENFLPAAEEMTKRGYFAIRMGAVVNQPLSISNPKVIDYSIKHRTDFLDIFLTAKCKFFIGTNAGIADVADIFRKPIVRTNVTQFFAEIALCGKKDLFIPKKLWLKEKGRFMTFREMVSSPVWESYYSEQFEQAGLEVIENTPEEILDIVIEMDERLEGKWENTSEDERLQSRFWSILAEAGKLKRPPVSRIGARFLRQNQELLDR